MSENNSEKFNEVEVRPFDAILAEELSIAVHNECCDCCPHDVGILLAQIAEEFYMDYFRVEEEANKE